MLRLFSSIIIIISVAKFAHSGNYLKCGKNEILTKCENQVCEYRKCSDVGQPIECEKVDRKYCIKGCICRKNYLKASNGTCIPADQCPPSCGKNEIPTSCIEEINERRSCSDLSEPVSCVQVDQQFCTDGCLCKDGYLRNSYGICIPINKCPEAQCGDNEKFELCPAPCPGEECGADLSLANCLPSPEPGSPSCQPSCRCCDGYKRNKEGCCIPEDKCPISCGVNEIPTACIQLKCELRDCSDIPEPVSCVRVNPSSCTDGCLCANGYLRAKNGTCILMNKCPEAQCGDNEKFDFCPAPCPGEECGADPSLANCLPSPEPGSPSCQPSCRCCDGYKRNKDGCCIPEDKCPPSIICGPNEEYNSCVNGNYCGRRNCSQPGIICIDLIEGGCIEGCLCKEGHLRAINGTCIPEDQCPLNCFGKNEVAGCQSTCAPQTCESIGRKYKCPEQTEECIQECRCKPGYYRNAIGECVSKADCLKCPGPNEYFSCGGACDNVCATLAIQNQTSCPIDNVVCNPMCYCIEGYARDAYNTCIPISKCPPPQPPNEVKCGPNAVYDSKCTESYPECPPEDCDICLKILCEPIPDPPGCRCVDNHLRNRKGLCVPSEQCETIPKRRPSKRRNKAVSSVKG